VGRFLRHGVSR